MSKTVIILGAGASAQAGAPLMKDFLDRAEKVKAGDGYRNPDEAKRAFQLVFKALEALRHAHAKSKIDTRNVESVFAAFEMAKLLGTLPELQPNEIEQLPSAMTRVIQDTLERSVLFPRQGTGPFLPPEPYNGFVRLFQTLDPHQVTIISFNYDLCVDYALSFNSILVNYCLEEDGTKEGLKLLKLHGSLNWFRCRECSKITSYPTLDLTGARLMVWHPQSDKQFNLRIGPNVEHLTHCGKQNVLNGPIIVPPTSNKLVHHTELKSVWVAAATELAVAENILVFGYSLPTSDYFFRYLYALGSIGPARPKRFWVFDPCQDGSVENRFRALLGPETEDRFEIYQETFSNAVLLGLVHDIFRI